MIYLHFVRKFRQLPDEFSLIVFLDITTGWKAFYSVEKYTSFNPMIDYWLEMAMSDSAFFHTLIGCADSYISPKGWKRNRPATIKHLNEAISIVNKRIEREEIPTDATLVVVATMACVEVTVSHRLGSILVLLWKLTRYSEKQGHA